MKYMLLALMFASLTSHAQKYYPTSFDIPEVLSFEQLMYLPEGKRIEYIKDVRLALAEIEASMIKSAKGQSSAELEMWKEEINALLRNLGSAALPMAHAEVLCVAGYEEIDGRCLRQKLTSIPCRYNETQFYAAGRYYCQPKALNTQQVQQAPAVPQVKQEPAQKVPMQKAPAKPFLPQEPVLQQPPPSQKSNALVDLQKNSPALPALGGGNSQPVGKKGPTPENEEAEVKKRGYRTVELAGTCKKREEAKNYHSDAASAYKAVPYRNCLMGGMFSEYNGEIKAGNCKKVQEFPPNTDKAAEKLKCSGNKAMCNPMLYCGPKKGEAHCLKVTQNLTNDCEKKASPNCDPFSGETMVPGAQAQWEEFAGDMNKLCGGDKAGKRFNEYFCEECSMLKKRMVEIEKKFAAFKANMPATSAGAAPAAAAPAEGRATRESGGPR